MCKKIFILLFCFILLFVFSHAVINSIVIEDRVLVYLEKKYGQEFILYEQVENIDEMYLCAYSISPEVNTNIIFIAGKKYTTPIFPFFPPIKNQTFYDTYFEDAKQYLTETIVPKETLVINDVNDIQLVTTKIYKYMEQLNNELEKLGFEVTNYTCSLTLTIQIQKDIKQFYFYVLNESTIYNMIRNDLCG